MLTRKEMLLSLADSAGSKSEALTYFKIYTIAISTFFKGVAKESSIIDITKLSSEDLKLTIKEMQNGQPFYNTRVVVYFYTLAEETVKNCLKAFFINSNREDVDLSGIRESKRSKFLQFFDLETAEREKECDALIHTFEGLFRGNYKYGPERFLAFFKVLGFEFEAEFEGMEEYLEFAQVRNCLVHNNGIVDKKLIELCPKYSMYAGKKLIVSIEDVIRFVQVERSFTYFLSESIVKYFENSGTS